jgi:hypothetical protein
MSKKCSEAIKLAPEKSKQHMLWLYLTCKEKWEEIVDTKKIGGDGGGRCWNSFISGERSSNPLTREISIALHRLGGKREPQNPRNSGHSRILEGGGHGAKAFERPPLATIWPQYGLYMATTCKTVN